MFYILKKTLTIILYTLIIYNTMSKPNVQPTPPNDVTTTPLWPNEGADEPRFDTLTAAAEYITALCGLDLTALNGLEGAETAYSPNVTFPGIPQTAALFKDRTSNKYLPTEGIRQIVADCMSGELPATQLTEAYRVPVQLAVAGLRIPVTQERPAGVFFGLLRPEDGDELSEDEVAGTIDAFATRRHGVAIVLELEDGSRIPFTPEAIKQLANAGELEGEVDPYSWNTQRGVFRVGIDQGQSESEGTISMATSNGKTYPLPGQEGAFDSQGRVIVEVYFEGE